MTPQETQQILLRAIATYGQDAQTLMLFEEMGELASAIGKYHRDRSTKQDVAEEIADVIIMCQQMAIIFGQEEVDAAIDFKLRRLDNRLNNPKPIINNLN